MYLGEKCQQVSDVPALINDCAIWSLRPQGSRVIAPLGHVVILIEIVQTRFVTSRDSFFLRGDHYVKLTYSDSGFKSSAGMDAGLYQSDKLAPIINYIINKSSNI